MDSYPILKSDEIVFLVKEAEKFCNIIETLEKRAGEVMIYVERMYPNGDAEMGVIEKHSFKHSMKDALVSLSKIYNLRLSIPKLYDYNDVERMWDYLSFNNPEVPSCSYIRFKDDEGDLVERADLALYDMLNTFFLQYPGIDSDLNKMGEIFKVYKELKYWVKCYNNKTDHALVSLCSALEDISLEEGESYLKVMRILHTSIYVSMYDWRSYH